MQCSQHYLNDSVKLGNLVTVVGVGQVFVTGQLRESKHGVNHAGNAGPKKCSLRDVTPNEPQRGDCDCSGRWSKMHE